MRKIDFIIIGYTTTLSLFQKKESNSNSENFERIFINYIAKFYILIEVKKHKYSKNK
jgi:hypothetical protein